METTGQAIWDAYDGDQLNPGHQALIREYARCADTADRLDGLLNGRREQWIQIMFDDMGEVHLSVDKILDQARNNQVVLRGLHLEIRQAGLRAQTPTAAAVETKENEDQLTKRRREREERERKLG